MLIATALGILVVMGLVLARAIRGPTVYDRILAVNSFGTLTVLLISVHGFIAGRPDFLDIPLVYAIINFIGTVAVCKYVTYSNLGGPLKDKEWSDI